MKLISGIECQLQRSDTCTKISLRYSTKTFIVEDKTKVLKTNGSLIDVESIAECSNFLEHYATLLTCIKLSRY